MAKSDRDAAPKKEVPQAGITPGPRAFENLLPAVQPISPKAVQATRAELLSRLKKFGPGWDDEIESLLAIPDSLFKIETETAAYYCADEKFGILGAIADLQFGKVRKNLPEYAVALYSSGGAAFFFLVDGRRGIIVRERMVSVHREPPERGWASVKDDVKSALLVSKIISKDGRIAVYDESLKILTPEV